MSTMWQPLSIRLGFITGKVTEGPLRAQFQMKCLDLRGGGLLTDDEKLESSPSEKLPSPIKPEERLGKTAARKSFDSLGGASVTEATVVIWEDDAGLVEFADLAR